jgi:hypothetical protein
MILADPRCIVGVDPTSRGIAFVFFERGELLDWGHFESDSDESEQLALLDRIIDGCAADVLVLEDPEAHGARRKPRLARLLQVFAKHGTRRGLAVMKVSRVEARGTWTAKGATTKEKAASLIAELIPELKPLVPPIRKIGANEAERVNIFDAATLVLHHDATLP